MPWHCCTPFTLCDCVHPEPPPDPSAHSAELHWLSVGGLLFSCLLALLTAGFSHIVTAWLDLHTVACVLACFSLSSFSCSLAPLDRCDQAATQFKNSLAKLMEILMSKEPSYVRCIKPNDAKQAGLWEMFYTLAVCLLEIIILQLCSFLATVPLPWDSISMALYGNITVLLFVPLVHTMVFVWYSKICRNICIAIGHENY